VAVGGVILSLGMQFALTTSFTLFETIGPLYTAGAYGYVEGEERRGEGEEEGERAGRRGGKTGEERGGRDVRMTSPQVGGLGYKSPLCRYLRALSCFPRVPPGPPSFFQREVFVGVL
jgi:hypothetical protein